MMTDVRPYQAAPVRFGEGDQMGRLTPVPSTAARRALVEAQDARADNTAAQWVADATADRLDQAVRDHPTVIERAADAIAAMVLAGRIPLLG